MNRKLPWSMLLSLVLTVSLAVTSISLGAEKAPAGGLLRNGDFQDDWLTILPELKNHHWNYTSEVYNRRDYNPDQWTLSGSWQWKDADAPRGRRRLILSGPGATVSQSVNWVTVHNPARLAGWPDAGGYPAEEPRRSKNPLALVRDLTLRVKLTGQGVVDKAGEIVLTLDEGPTAVSVTAPLPAGNYQGQVVTVALPAATWLEKAKTDKDFAAQGALLPKSVTCTINYKGPAGTVELHEATLEAAESQSPALLAGGFEQLDAKGYPIGWSQPQKYYYFAPGLYYNFNTWHNSSSDFRGPVSADALVPFRGQRSLKMIVASGDEMCVVSDPIAINQAEPRLIEATVWVKTDRLSTLQVDAEDEDGRRIPCYNFIQKYPLSIGSNDWRQLRQVFSPGKPVKSMRIKLAARGVNGYTLDDTSQQPQNNACGTVWWDELKVYEPESTAAELQSRGAKPVAPAPGAAKQPYLANLDPGEELFGANELTATIVNPGSAGAFKLEWELTSPSGKSVKFESPAVSVPKGGRTDVRLPYPIAEPCPAYTEYRGALKLTEGKKVISESQQWLATWTMPVDLELGALYMQPGQSKAFVKVNLGLTYAEVQKAKSVRLEVIRRSTGKAVSTMDVPVSLAAIEAQRQKISAEMRDDFRNLLLADLDVSSLPDQPFNDPQRNWFVRATVLDQGGKPMARADSQPFCRLAHDPPQPAIQSVKIDTDGLLYVNDQPWIAWGVTYGHTPVYAGPADPGPGKYHDLKNLKPWGIYDRHGGNLVSRPVWDGTCVRWVAGSASPVEKMQDYWTKQNLYASSAFVCAEPAWSMDIVAKARGNKGPGDKDKLDAYLAYCKDAPMVVSTAPGVEEAFGEFSNASDAQIAGMGQVVEYFRKATGKPVMVGHGGYWNRFEFERVPYFDIYDPETEPLYPANLHTDLRPLIAGKAKVAWLRPQMYEDVPYERWRFHVWVEMMRGARGWQLAHGPGDASTFRGLHAEMEQFKPILYSKTPAPKVTIEPVIENLVRKLGNKTYIVAATTHGMQFGTWRWADGPAGPEGKPRVTGGEHAWRDDSNGYSVTGPPMTGPSAYGLQFMAHPRNWPAGSKLVQWIKTDAATPEYLLAIVKNDGRWTAAASWGKFDLAPFRELPSPKNKNTRCEWFLRTFYRYAPGFMGWGGVPAYALAMVPDKTVDQGAVPPAGRWVKLEVPLDKIGAADKLVDGVGFMHQGGKVLWGRTSLVAPDGSEQVVIGDDADRPAPAQLKAVKVSVAGLKKGAKVRVLYEDRDIVAEDGFFTDDFTGTDLYERFGGRGTGYGDAPVALHVYAVETK